MRSCGHVVIGIVAIYTALTGYAVIKALTSMSKPVFTAPANWEYAAARDGHTFHAKGCPAIPTLPPEQMVYGNSVAEMLRVHDKNPCDYCIQDTANK